MATKISFLSYYHTKFLRGVAILLVAISHIGNYSGKTWFTPLGGIGVAIFLFCSAYGLSCSYRKNGLTDYWKKKFFAVYYPFFLIEIIVSLIYKVPVQEFIQDILFIRWLNPNGWYMQYLAVCYILFYIGMKYIDNKKVRMGLWCIIAFCSFILCGNLRAEQAVSFVLGLVVAEKYEYIEKITPKRKVVMSVLLLLVGLILLSIKQIPVVRVQPQLLISFINLLMKSSFMLAVILATTRLCFRINLIVFIGEISYPFYLIHGYFMWIIADNFTGYYFVNSMMMCTISFVLSIFANCIISKRRKSVTNNEC